MTKTYINHAIIGNSSMLGCLSDKGELVRLFWPNIDYPQHVERSLAGIFLADRKNSTVWLNDERLEHQQCYITDTNILKTCCIDRERELETVQYDFVLPDRDILVRRFEITNTGCHDTDLGFVLYSSAVTTTPETSSTLFDFSLDALVHYRHGYYLSVSADREICQFQLGNNAVDSAVYTELKGYDSIGMMPDGALSWKLGLCKPGEKKVIHVHFCAAHSLKQAKRQAAWVRTANSGEIYENTRKYWEDFVGNLKKVHTGRAEIDALYKRTLLVFELMSDKKSGGLLAAPEIDEGFTRCGRYAYCWGRDAAFITGALDKCGLTEAVDRFYHWSAEVQDDEGSWQQRYHMDGNLAPSWGLQIDETGTLVWGMLQHYQATGDVCFLESMWESAKKAVTYMLEFMDPDTGLPRPSYDLWEERVGEHTYSSAAVYGGIRAAAEIGSILGKDPLLLEGWMSAAEDLKEAILRNLWKEEKGCFLRSVRTKLNPWGSEHSPHTVVIKANPKEYYRDVTLEDPMVDISLLGISIPFGVLDVEDPKVASTVAVIEKMLTSHNGGIRRYEWDGYIGGNPWILTTLWVALYYAKKKEYQKARGYFEWAVKGRTELDLLPEQVDRDNGKPAWVIPLTWSHAMFVLVLFELLEAGEI
jgi:glucoamylase